MRRRALAATVLVAGVVLGGCTAQNGPGAAPTVTPEAPPSGPELWASAAIWVSPDGDRYLCPVPFSDGGWGGPRICDDPLMVTGLDASPAPASPAAASPAPASPESEKAEDGWTWSPHVVTGHLDGTVFSVTGVDTAEALAAQAARFPPPDPNQVPAVGYATDEEKLAAMFAAADPAGYGCAAPEGGRRDAGDIEGLIGPYSAAYPEQVVGWASLWVAPEVHVALIGAAADADAEAVGVGMQKLFPGAACIVRSTISAAELQSTVAEPLFGPHPYVARSGSTADGRTTVDPYLWVSRIAPSDELDAAVARYPSGFVQVQTWFERLP